MVTINELQHAPLAVGKLPFQLFLPRRQTRTPVRILAEHSFYVKPGPNGSGARPACAHRLPFKPTAGPGREDCPNPPSTHSLGATAGSARRLRRAQRLQVRAATGERSSCRRPWARHCPPRRACRKPARSQTERIPMTAADPAAAPARPPAASGSHRPHSQSGSDWALPFTLPHTAGTPHQGRRLGPQACCAASHEGGSSRPEVVLQVPSLSQASALPPALRRVGASADSAQTDVSTNWAYDVTEGQDG